MLAGETAMGKFPEQSVRICAKVILEAEARIRLDGSLDRRLDLKPSLDTLEIISQESVRISGARVIIVHTHTGYTALQIAK